MAVALCSRNSSACLHVQFLHPSFLHRCVASPMFAFDLGAWLELLWLWLASLSLQMYLPMLGTCSNSKSRTQHLSLFYVVDVIEGAVG